MTPVIPPDIPDKTNTEIILESTYINKNNDKIEINILNLSLINATCISVKRENFLKINNESIGLIFSNHFKTEKCIFDNINDNNKDNYTNLFQCQVQNKLNISNDNYTIQTPFENKYHINKSEKIRINNGAGI